MDKITLTNIKAKDLVNFLKLGEIDAPQTLKIDTKTLAFRAYPKSKAFIKAKFKPLEEICDSHNIPATESFKWPVQNTKKLVDILSMFAEKSANVSLHVDGGYVTKMEIVGGKKEKLVLVSGDIAHVPAWMEDDIWNKISNEDTKECYVEFGASDIKDMKKTYEVMHSVSSATKNVQRIVFIRATKSGMVFSNVSDDGGQTRNEWSFEWDNNYKNLSLDSEDRLFNLTNIMGLTDGGTMSIVSIPNGLKAMVIQSNITLVNILTPKT